MPNGNVARVSIGGSDLSNYFTTANMSFERDTSEVTPLGGNPRRQAVGPLGVTFSGEGEFDPAVHGVVGAAMTAEPPVPVQVTHSFLGTTYTYSMYISSYEIDTPGDDLGTFSMEAVLAITP